MDPVIKPPGAIYGIELSILQMYREYTLGLGILVYDTIVFDTMRSKVLCTRRNNVNSLGEICQQMLFLVSLIKSNITASSSGAKIFDLLMIASASKLNTRETT